MSTTATKDEPFTYLPIGTPFSTAPSAEPVKEEAPKEESAAMQRRRANPIYQIEVFKSGQYEIEGSTKIAGDGPNFKWRAIAPYVWPLGVRADTNEGRAIGMFAGNQGVRVGPVPHSDEIGIYGLVEWDLEGVIISPDLAFKVFFDQLEKKIREDVEGTLDKLKAASKTQIAMPSGDDVQRYGGKLG